MKHTIKQIGVVLFFGVLVAVMNACSKSSDEKKETIPSDNVKVTTFAGSGSEGSADGTGTAASFNLPSDITSDGTNFYVADHANFLIRKIVIASAVVTTFAGSGERGGYADGTGTGASFGILNGMTSDGTNLYVTTGENVIRKIVIASAVVTTFAGTRSYSGSTDDDNGTAASFNSPQGITNDGTNLYVADKNNHAIRKIVISSGAVTTIAGTGDDGCTDGTGTSARFTFPMDITNDGTNLYVADAWCGKIRKIVIASGVVTTLAGSGLPGSVDGTGTAASFDTPTAITSDGSNLYVSDESSDKIRKIVIASGEVTTIAGTGDAGCTDGTGTVASFADPAGMTIEGTNLYIADYICHAIRKIEL